MTESVTVLSSVGLILFVTYLEVPANVSKDMLGVFLCLCLSFALKIFSLTKLEGKT